MGALDAGNKSGETYIGLILAAGFSSRMGDFKPLLQIGDMTAVQRVSAALKQAGVHKIIGVTGFLRRKLVPVFESEGIMEAYNPDFEQGMFTSVKAGIRAAMPGLRPAAPAGAGKPDPTARKEIEAPDFGKPDPAGMPEGFFLMPVDCPLVPPEVIRRIAEKHREDPEAFIVPCFRGKKGHPLFIPAKYAEEILAYEGEGGLKAITGRYEDKLIRMETGVEAVVLDMDTPEGYEEVLEYYRAYEKETRGTDGEPDAETCPGRESGTGAAEGYRNALAKALKGKRLFLIRHGEIRQHREKIFLGQTDVPLSDKGREQAEAAAEELLRHGVSMSRIYTSDLSRAVQTAEIIRDRLSRGARQDKPDGGVPVSGASEAAGAFRAEVIREPRLREMALGEWDGRFISDIQKEYPEEYRRRGENLLTWKFGNDSENFYDLQYRVMKGFQSILKRERAPGEPKDMEDIKDIKDNTGFPDAGQNDIVIVSHSGVINVILSNLRQTELAEQIAGHIPGHIPNGGVVAIDYTVNS
jgi:broad specificity phosphatase PhoE/CTP:molybdopterin cytidylyltransferase MocA